MKLPSDAAARLTRFSTAAAAYLGKIDSISVELEPLMIELGFLEANLREEGYTIVRSPNGDWTITGKPRSRYVADEVLPPPDVIARAERLAGRIVVLKAEQKAALDAHAAAQRFAGNLTTQVMQGGYSL